jgi:uncharacterized membrane protein
MSRPIIEKFAGFVFGTVLVVGLVSILTFVALLLSQEWTAAVLSLIAAAISFSALLMILFKD